MSLWSRLSQKSTKAKEVEVVPQPRKRRRRRLPKRLSREDVVLLLDQPDLSTWRGLRDRCMLEMMYRGGLRVSEIVNLRPTDIEVDRDGNGVIHVWEGKGGVDRTSYFDPGSIMPLFELWLSARTKRGFDDGDALFCSSRGTSLTTRTVQLMVVKHKKSAGIRTSCTPHTLRHTFASELIEDGFSTREVQELLGHASVATTEVYTHLAADRLALKVRNRGTI